MSSILVPLDGSALAGQVLPHARYLATILAAQIQLLRVVSDADKEALLAHEDVLLARGRGPALTRQARERRAWQQLTTHAESYLAEQAAQLNAIGMAVAAEVRTGYPAEMIVHFAAERRSDLIVMATHGYSGVTRWLLGSVADKVVQAAMVPVLLVRGTPPPEYRIRRLLVPLDGSPLACLALPFAIDLAQRVHAEIVLLQAIPPTIGTYPYVVLPAGVRELLHMQALHELQEVADDLHQRGLTATPLVTGGEPAEVVVETTAQQQVDLIVMATHGYSGIKRWALGSVADKVMHAAKTPLLLIRAQTNMNAPDALEPEGEQRHRIEISPAQ
ncbi:MAG TPA: universal stress protein [Roseiflexaceae bacterium]|nr:universal stress protein [Roseiflexaceae bacterium]